jgi:hypothetical protein
MTEALPPFDPPYVTFFGAGDDIYCIETLSDGTTRPVAISRRAFQPGINNADTGSKRRPKFNNKALPASVSRHGNEQIALYLNVPFSEKDKAKNLGAKWDAKKKKWYVPNGLDLNRFSCWWSDDLK